MQQALTTPVMRSVVVGALFFGMGLAGALTLPPRHEPMTRRLVLHAHERPNAIYLSAWRDGDLRVTFEDGQLRPITFHVRATLADGCRWMGTETLVPIDARTFAYEYDDTSLDCAPHETQYIPTPRTGLVTVENP